MVSRRNIYVVIIPDELRNQIYEKYGLEIIKELLANKGVDVLLKKKARRVLGKDYHLCTKSPATFGIDPDPQSKPLKILCLDVSEKVRNNMKIYVGRGNERLGFCYDT